MSLRTKVRPAAAKDFAAIDALLEAAFAGREESGIVARLREAGLAAIDLVAVRDEAIEGMILFSPLACEIDGRAVKALALAPVAVLPGLQGRGIGSGLIREGLARAQADGFEAVILLGHEAYYPRFGFSAALAQKLVSPFPGPHFMALELVPGALEGMMGRVTYPPPFGV